MIKGTYMTIEQKQRLSIAHKHQVGTWKGKHLPLTTRKKISSTVKAHPTKYWLGKKFSVVHKKKMQHELSTLLN